MNYKELFDTDLFCCDLIFLFYVIKNVKINWEVGEEIAGNGILNQEKTHQKEIPP